MSRGHRILERVIQFHPPASWIHTCLSCNLSVFCPARWRQGSPKSECPQQKMIKDRTGPTFHIFGSALGGGGRPAPKLKQNVGPGQLSAFSGLSWRKPAPKSIFPRIVYIKLDCKLNRANIFFPGLSPGEVGQPKNRNSKT